MQVSSNIIRFPTPTVTALQHRAERTAEPQENVVDFQPNRPAEINGNAREYGQFFAAHRIVTRVAAELDMVAAL